MVSSLKREDTVLIQSTGCRIHPRDVCVSQIPPVRTLPSHSRVQEQKLKLRSVRLLVSHDHPQELVTAHSGVCRRQ